MTPLQHIFVLVFVAISAIISGIAVGLCITAKRADEAISAALRARDEEVNLLLPKEKP